MTNELENILSKKVISVSREVNVSAVIAIMVENRISSIVITENKKPVGIFTERDVVRLAHRNHEFNALSVNDVMSTPVFTVSIDDTVFNIFNIYALIQEKKIRHIVVVDAKGDMVGVVTFTDIVNNLGFEFYVEFKSVLQVMKRDVLTIKKDLPVIDAVNKMKSNSISCIVVEENTRPIGIVTERDITHLVKGNHDLNSLTIENVMSAPVHTLNVSSHIYTVSEILKEKKIRRLVIVDHNFMICGIVTQTDIIKCIEKKYVEFLINLIKTKDEKLKESIDELKQKTVFFDSIMCTTKDVAIIGMDLDFTIKYYNPYAETIFETKIMNLKGKTLVELLKGRGLDDSCLQNALDSIKNRDDFDYLFKLERDGVKKFIRAKIFGVWGNDDELLGLAFMGQDTTEHLMTNEQMLKMANAVEQSPDSIVITNMNCVIEYVNPAFVKLTGYSREEVIGKTPKMLQSGKHGKLFYEKLWDTILTSNAFSGVFVNKKKSGEFFYEDKTITPISITIGEKKHTHFVSTGKDITVCMKMEEELQKNKRIESLGILAGGIAHDFNNILTTILGNTNLSMLLINPKDKIYKNLSDVEAATMRAKDLTRQLLLYAKGGLPIKETSSVIELIKSTVEFALRGSNIICEFNFAKDLYNVEVDKGQIHQVVNNLVINSMQAMPTGGVVKVSCQNVFGEQEDDVELANKNYIKITFQDQGCGIKKEDIKNIFNPYFTTKTSGSGLGLASLLSIITNHGGAISVDSEPGKGTSFFIYIPASAKEVVGTEKASNVPIKARGKVLLMDDDKSIRDLTGNILDYMGFEVETGAVPNSRQYYCMFH